MLKLVSNPALEAAVDALDGLTLEELRLVNHELVGRIREMAARESRKASLVLTPGMNVWFDAKTRGVIHGVLLEFNRDRTKAKVKQVGGRRDGCMWTAPVSSLHKEA